MWKRVRIAPVAFTPVDPQAKLTALEHETLKFWADRGILNKSIDQRERGRRGDWVFYDGPPGTNGSPHIGHMLQSALKDLWPRFKTMQGYRVLRKAGWDTHGLPVELQAEKELGLDSKRDIHNFGMAKYVAYCRNTVFRYENEWIKAINRIGRFLDTTDAYATLTNDYIQTDWWVIKQAWDKGLLYKDFKVLPYCTRCGTTLSSHEVAQGYQDVTDTSVYVRLPLKDQPGVSLVVWTTTPWTLVANVAVAVNPKVQYVRVKYKSGKLILAAALADKVLGEGTYEIEERFDGDELLDKSYEPPFNFFEPEERAFYVVGDDYVTTEDGTGLVHLAAYGEDDFRLIKRYKLPLIQHLDLEGHLKPEVSRWSGKSFKEVDKEVVRDLNERGLLLKSQPHKHSYPFCWRCKTPLIYDAQSSWFIRTTDFADKMLANNRKINWQPAHIKEGRFGRWLEGNVDWAVSRARFWGSPLPVWQCRECKEYAVVENVKELRALAMDELPPDDKIDLHRPWIDEVRLKCADCNSKTPMLREPDVLDCWFNAGVMPWGQWGYPVKAGSAAMVKSQYPADFICEGLDQTRGWFYVLLATSTMLTGKSSFKNVICTDLILDEKGHKMSKSVGNVVEPLALMEQYGADVVRWWFFRADPWLARRYSDREVLLARDALLRPLWNVYSFFVTYANVDKFTPTQTTASKLKPAHVLDRWILAELDALVITVTAHLENFDVAPAAAAIERFIDGLSNWYVRRSRRRFWKSDSDTDKHDAEETLYHVLVELSRLLAPFTPFVAEHIYRNLTSGGLYTDGDGARGRESVHLDDWPTKSKRRSETTLLTEMDQARTVVTLALRARQDAKMRVRQPLATLTVALPGGRGSVKKLGAEAEELVKDEINVKELRYAKKAADLGTAETKLNFAVAGKKYGAEVKEIQKALLAGTLKRKLAAEDVLVTYRGKAGTAVAGDKGVLVALDVTLTTELEDEGLVREVVRAVQDLRKEAGYAVSDRIGLIVATDDKRLAAAVKKFGDYLKGETLATSVTNERGAADKSSDFTLGTFKAWLGVRKA